MKYPLYLIVFLFLFGCMASENELDGVYVGNLENYRLTFNGDVVQITTPNGELTKRFDRQDSHIEIMYGKSTEVDTILSFYQDSDKSTLLCKECAKYSLPSRWSKLEG